MLRFLRQSARVSAPLAALLASIIVAGTVDWWHGDDEDAPVLFFHDHLAHHPRVGEVRSLTAPNEHCYICHWLRSLHSGLRDIGICSLTQGPTAILHVTASKDVVTLAAASLSTRAPPPLA